MSNDETISRRTALKILGVGVGVASAPSVLAQHPASAHWRGNGAPPIGGRSQLRFFTAAENDVDYLDERLDNSQ
jgi:hypothetical protein